MNDNEDEMLEEIQKKLDERAEAEKKRALRKKKAVRSGESEDKTLKKSDGIRSADVSVVVEEYQDPEDVPLPQKRRNSVNGAPCPALKKKRRKKRHPFIKLIAVLAIIVFGLHFFIEKLVDEINSQPLDTSYVRSDDVMSSFWVKNILVVGTDARNTDSNSRSDCIMILSLNIKERKLVISSILRDSYVTIPGYGQNRINAAFQYGGAELLIQTIESNFRIGIDHYVKVDFFSFINIIDSIGGVEIDVDGEEAQYVNMYLCEINQLLGVAQGDGNLTATGMQTLSGKQALGYARIRYIGTDFARTGRQREVLNAVFDKAKSLNPVSLLKLCSDVSGEITTDMTSSQLAWLIMECPAVFACERSECRIPADGTWSNYITDSGMEVLQIDFDANIEALKQAIY